MKPYLGKVSTLNHKPTVKIVKVGPVQTLKGERKRLDFYVDLDLEVDGKPIAAKFHLMDDKHFSKSPLRSLTFNLTPRRNVEDTSDCPICSGNSGVTTDETNGLTAIACAEAIVPEMEKIGLKAKAYSDKAGGWFTFQAWAKKLKSEDGKGYASGVITWNVTIDCPVHGQYVSVYAERDCD